MGIFFSESVRGRQTRFWIWDLIFRKLTPSAKSPYNHLSNEAFSASLKFVSWYAIFFFRWRNGAVEIYHPLLKENTFCDTDKSFCLLIRFLA